MANLNGVLTKGRVVSLLATSLANVSKCLYQVVYAISDPSSGEGGLLLNPQIGAENPMPIFVAFTGEETLAGAMLTVPGIGGVLRLDPSEQANFNWPNGTTELFNTADGDVYLIENVLGDPAEYAPPSGFVPTVAPVAPVVLVPPAPIAGFDYDAWAAAFNATNKRTFKPTGGADDSIVDNPDQYTNENGFNQYVGTCFETMQANRTGVLGRADDRSPYHGDLVFFPFTPAFSPLLDPPGSYSFTTKVTKKTKVRTPAYYTTSTYVEYDSFWVDPYWGGFGGVGIVLY